MKMSGRKEDWNVLSPTSTSTVLCHPWGCGFPKNFFEEVPATKTEDREEKGEEDEDEEEEEGPDERGGGDVEERGTGGKRGEGERERKKNMEIGEGRGQEGERKRRGRKRGKGVGGRRKRRGKFKEDRKGETASAQKPPEKAFSYSQANSIVLGQGSLVSETG